MLRKCGQKTEEKIEKSKWSGLYDAGKKRGQAEQKEKLVFADAIHVVRKQISRARGSIQAAAVFIFRISQMIVKRYRANSRSLCQRYNCFPGRGTSGAEVQRPLFAIKLKNRRLADGRNVLSANDC